MKEHITMVDNWKEVTLEQYLNIMETLNSTVLSDAQKNMMLISILCNMEYEEMEEIPLTTYLELLNHADFLNKECPKVLAEQVEVNDNLYDINYAIAKISTNMYIDFSTYMNDGDMDSTDKLLSLLSIFITPHNHKYNDGYDMAKMKEELLSFPITLINGVQAFFLLLLKSWLTGMKKTMERKLRKGKMTEEQREQASQMLQSLGSAISAL